jgi:predicted PurR-regulated permease PerM
VGLPGIWILVAITVGGSLFGVVGMLVFIPLMATAYSLIRESVNKRNRIKETQ